MSFAANHARRSGRIRRHQLRTAVTELLEPRRLLSAYSLSALFTFNGNNGAQPETGLTLFNGKLYGTTSFGGDGNFGETYGSVYSVDPATNKVTTDIATFDGANGNQPDGRFTAVGQDLFSVSEAVSISGAPGISEFNPATDQLSLFATFPPSTQYNQNGNGLVPATIQNSTIDVGGNLYGEALNGGANGSGFIYECNISTKTITVLGSFQAAMDPPIETSVSDTRLLDYNGILYGTVQSGGTHNNGYIFQYNLSTKAFKIDYSFSGGGLPICGLTNINGLFYGTTYFGGTDGLGLVYSFNPANNTVTTLANFNGANGAYPQGDMTDINGNLFGATQGAGPQQGAFPNGYGAIFEYNVSSHSLTAAATFNGSDGNAPLGGLVDVNGSIYGNTWDSVPPNSFAYASVFAVIPAQTLQLSASLNNITLRIDPTYKNDVEVLNGSTKVEDISLDAPSLTISGGSSANSVTIDYKSGGFFSLPVTFTGSGSSNTLSILDGTTGSPKWNVGSGKITAGNSGLTAAPTINFSGVQKVSLTGRSSGDETFLVQNTPHTGVTLPTMTTLNVSSNDVVNVTGTASPLTIVGAGSSATNLDGVDIGSLAPNLGGTLTGILAPITVNNVSEIVADDSGNKSNMSGALSASSISGFGLPAADPISYKSVNTLKLYGGAAVNSETINSNSANTTLYPGGGGSNITVNGNAGPLTINGGGHTDSINIGLGTLANITAPITVTSTGSASTLVIDAASTTTAHSGTISSTSITGFSMGASAAVNYTGSQLEALTLIGGSGANTDTITGTSTHTILYPGTSSAATVNVRAAAAPLTINGSAKTDFITVGSLAPSPGGTLTAITAPITVANTSASSTLTLDDSGDTTSRSGVISATSVTGFGIGGSGAVNYTGKQLASLTIHGGAGADNTETITGTSTPTTLYPGASHAGESTVNIRATTAALTINGDGNEDLITIGSLAPSLGGTLTGITAPITVTNTSNQSTLTLDDSGDTIDRTGTLTPTTITGLGMPSGAKVTYTGSGLHLLTLRGNKGGAKLTETGTSCPVTLVNITKV